MPTNNDLLPHVELIEINLNKLTNCLIGFVEALVRFTYSFFKWNLFRIGVSYKVHGFLGSADRNQNDFVLMSDKCLSFSAVFCFTIIKKCHLAGCSCSSPSSGLFFS